MAKLKLDLADAAGLIGKAVEADAKAYATVEAKYMNSADPSVQALKTEPDLSMIAPSRMILLPLLPSLCPSFLVESSVFLMTFHRFHLKIT